MVVNFFLRRLQEQLEIPRHILHVHHRTPRFAITVNDHFASGGGATDEVVEHRVKPHARRHAVNCAVADVDRRKILVRHLHQRVLGFHFRPRVFRLWIERGIFSNVCRARRAIHDARGRKQEAFDAGRAIAALQIVFDVLAAEIAEGEDDEGQITALQDAMVRLKVFIVAEISEDDEDDEQPSDVLEQAASTSDLAKIAETLEAARLERDAQKALLAELAPRLEKLGQRVEELARQPLPPPMLAGTRAVEKGAEARVEDLAATLAAMTGEQRAALLIKVAQSQPRTLR